MKNLKYLIVIAFALSIFSSCKKDESPAPTAYYEQADQMGRPAVNTVFIGSADKDKFNTTIPSVMGSVFKSQIMAKLTAFGYTPNALGQDASTFAGLLATDVLNVNTTAPATTFFDGTNVLTGRNLSDDVIDVELLLIFGGSDFKSNPGLTSDNVAKNDKAFLPSFPYLASPW